MSHFLSPIFAPGFFESEAVHIALGVGALVAVVTGVVGVFTVMRGQSFAGEAFGDLGTTGGSGAYLVGVGTLWGFVIGNVIAAGAMEAIGVQRARGRDLATGIVLGAGIGLAALFLHLYTTEHSTTGATVTILFGSVFAISSTTIPLILLLGAIVLAITLTIYRPLLLSSVNAEIASARGIPVRLIGVLYLLALALAAALAAITIGTILSTALLVGPAASALRLTRRPLTALLTAAGIGDRRHVARHHPRLRQLPLATRRPRLARQLLRRDPRVHHLPAIRAPRGQTPPASRPDPARLSGSDSRRTPS